MRRPLRVVAIILAVLAAAALIASRITLNYYALQPGDAQPVNPLITVPMDKAHHVHGSIFLTDVFVTPVNALDYLFFLGDAHTALVPTDELVSPGVPPSELTAQGYLEMVQAKQAAKTAALRRLGYSVPETDGGVVIEAVVSGTPASGVLHVGQVVTAVDGTATPNHCAFVTQLAAVRPGDTVRLTVQQNRFSGSGGLVTGKLATESIRVAARPAGLAPDTECAGFKKGAGYLGVSIATQENFTFPFPITIDTANIGGPSAGLPMTLGLLDTLSGGHLTGGRKVAATGTMSPTGQIGDVGGVAQKTVAVEKAGASVFFVPLPELSAARSEATPGLHIYAVGTLAQVLTILGRLGGRVPPR